MNVRRAPIIALLAATAMTFTVTGCNQETEGAPPPTATSTSTGGSGGSGGSPTAQHDEIKAAKARLAKQSGYPNPAVVPVKNGFRGATIGKNNTLDIWSGDLKSWQRDDSKKLIQPTGNRPPTVEAGFLPGAFDASFIVRGDFTGNATGQALAYGYADGKWGLYVAQPDGSLKADSTRQAALGSPGLQLQIVFTENGLRTTSMWGPDASAANATQKTHPVVRDFAHSRTDEVLKLTGSNTMSGQRQPRHDMPATATAPKVTNGALPDGTWQVEVGQQRPGPNSRISATPLRTEKTGCGGEFCLEPTGEHVTLRVVASTKISVPTKENGNLTIPAWIHDNYYNNPDTGASILLEQFKGGPYQAPTGVTALLKGRGYATVTITGGVLTSITYSDLGDAP